MCSHQGPLTRVRFCVWHTCCCCELWFHLSGLGMSFSSLANSWRVWSPLAKVEGQFVLESWQPAPSATLSAFLTGVVELRAISQKNSAWLCEGLRFPHCTQPFEPPRLFQAPSETVSSPKHKQGAGWKHYSQPI